MATHGKNYRKVSAKTEDRVYAVSEAISFLKANKIAKFDETAELAIRLGVDTRRPTRRTRYGRASHGTGKAVRVAVFAAGAAADAARAAGADFVGNDD